MHLMPDRLKNNRAYNLLDVFIKIVVRSSFFLGSLCAIGIIVFYIAGNIAILLYQISYNTHHPFNVWLCSYLKVPCPRHVEGIRLPPTRLEMILWGAVVTAIVLAIGLFLYRIVFSQPVFTGQPVRRLAIVSKEIIDAFDRANDAQRRKAIIDLCLFAISQQNLNNESVNKAMEVLKNKKFDQPLIATELASLSNKADDQYFELEEQKRDSESRSAFFQGRLFAALSFAMTLNSAALHDAIYEAIKACNDEPEALKVAERALTAEPPTLKSDGQLS